MEPYRDDVTTSGTAVPAYPGVRVDVPMPADHPSVGTTHGGLTLMRLSVRTGAVATALAATLLLAGCAADDETDTATPEATESAAAEDAADAEETAPTGPAEVPDVTNLILETAQGNLVRAGLEAETVDETGAPVSVDDATGYTVTAQEPSEGTLEPGETVTLTVAPRG